MIKRLLLILCVSTLNACSTSQDSLLNYKVVYTKTINQNYSSLGSCIKSKFPPTSINRQSVYMASTGTTHMTGSSQGINVREDKNEKAYYINHFFGSINQEWAVKYWLITIRGVNESNIKSEIKIQGRRNIFGQLAFSLPELEDKINQCVKD